LLVVSPCFAQASLSISGNPTSYSLEKGQSVSGFFVLTNNDNVNNVTGISITQSSLPYGATIIFTPQLISYLQNGSSTTINFVLSVNSSTAYGSKTITVYANGVSNGTNVSTSFNFDLDIARQYCENGDKGTRVKLIVDNPESGDDFYVGRNLTVDLNADNRYDDSLDIVVEVELFDQTTEETIDDNSIDDSLDEDEDKDYSLDLDIPSDLDTSDDYVINVKVYEDGEEGTQCRQKTIPIDVKRKTHDLVISRILLSNEDVGCGESLGLTVKIENAGSKDENDVEVTISSSALNFSATKTRDIDSEDTGSFVFSDTLPIVKPGVYAFYIDVSSNSVEETDAFSLNLQRNCVVQKPDAAITVSQQGTGEVGQNGLSKITVINTGTTSTTYNISISDYQSWAELVTLAPQTVTLSPGEKADIYLTLRPNSNAGSVNTFYVQVVFGENVKTGMGNMQVNKGASTGTFFSDLWDAIVKNLALAIINSILVIAVIVLLIVALTRRSRNTRNEPTEMRLKAKTNGNGKRKRK
jgi:hypothetical protein